ncbi:MAG: SUMF1/EgtB/PvdO family nonheme iron enzyme [Deltaproteobacteria bacterium]|nr:SUMF1/EgtB/PvdO family nonheme iron enzyme [Deltaproteobacteria bacterium]
MRASLSVLLPVLPAIAACVTGRTPPEPTKLVPVDTSVTFAFGGGDGQCFPLEKTQNDGLCDLAFSQDVKKAWPLRKVRIAPFAIEEHEVTNFQYEHCVLLGKCDEPVAFAVGAIQEQYFANPTYHDYPVLNLSHRMAEQYCAFVGRRLPYEWEWERVAAGSDPEGKRKYAIAGDRDLRECLGKDGLRVQIVGCNGNDLPAPVMSNADDLVQEGGQAIYDLTGNVAEYVAGYFREGVTCKEEIPASCDCWACTDDNCKGACYTVCDTCKTAPCFKRCAKYPICIEHQDGAVPNAHDALFVPAGTLRLARGGSYHDTAAQTCFAYTTDRTRTVATDESKKSTPNGVRCAVDL